MNVPYVLVHSGGVLKATRYFIYLHYEWDAITSMQIGLGLPVHASH